MNMRPPGGLATMAATSDLLGDRTNDSVAGWQPLSSGQSLQYLSDTYHLISLVESEGKTPDAGCGCSTRCSMQADLVISPAYHVCPAMAPTLHRWPKYSPPGWLYFSNYIFEPEPSRALTTAMSWTIPIIIIETQASLSCWSIQWRKVNRI